ncbi:MAG: sensor histidine kinase, partial [Terriglobales bacterium]
ELLGTRAADLKGKADVDVLPAAVADEIRRDDRRILEEDVAAENETTIPNQEGTTRQFVVLKFPLRDATGSRWLGGLAFDVTERKAAELRLREVTETLREQAALLDLTQDSVIVRDLDGRVRFWNGGAEQIYGWTREEAQGQSLLQLLRPEYQMPWDAIHGELLRQGRWEGEVVHHRRNGSPVTVASRWALQRDLSGAPMAVLEINNDVTQRKEAADHLARQSQLLESSNAELQQFAYIASHDMKEPLRIVASYAQLLGKRYHGQLDAKADGFIAYMVDGVQRMQRLIDDLLEYSRVGGQRVAGVTVSADMALRQALANLRLAIQETGANVSFDGLPQVIAEPGKLVQLFQNLVANAIKFHGTAAPVIAVEAEFAKGHWQFAVRDNGIGFEPKYAERIFTIFEQLHGRGEHPGTGIGLAICKKIVEQFGGHIWAESQPGIGTTFYFTLPAVVAQGMSV